MRISVDEDTCQGHGRCFALAPDVFSADEEGYCAQRGTTVDVPPEFEEDAHMAIRACPEIALTLVEG